MKQCSTCGRFVDDRSDVCPEDGGRLISILREGTVIDGNYRLEQCLGHGGMGAVYRAVHLGIERECAVKLIRPARLANQEYVQRFHVEARALGRLEHPNILRVTDFGIDRSLGDVPYLVTELLAGGTLAFLLEDEPRLPLDRALPILASVADALDFAHSRGVLHRDLKPSNIFLCPDQAEGQGVRILDFGLAKLVGPSEALPGGPAALTGRTAASAGEERPLTGFGAGPAVDRLDGETLEMGTPACPTGEAAMSAGTTRRHTRRGTVLGTPGYIAPEVLQGRDASSASDVYALAVVAYEMLTGHHPYEQGGDFLSRPLRQAPSSPSEHCSGLPPEVDPVLLAALSRDPRWRPQRALELVSGLRRAARDARLRAWRARELPRRAVVACVVAITAALGTSLPVLADLENQLVDFRFGLCAPRPPSAGVVLLALDEAALEVDETPLVERGDEIGSVLRRALAAGAAGVAIDVLPPPQWRGSAELASLVLENPRRVVLAVLESREEDRMVGRDALDPLTVAALGPEQTRRLFGVVNLPLDSDATMRQGRVYFRERSSGLPLPSFAARAAEIHAGRPIGEWELPQRFWVDYTVDWRQWPWLSWKDVATAIATDPGLLRGRVAILGAPYLGSGDEAFPVPHAGDLPEAAPGFVLHALAMETMLGGCRLRSAPPGLVMLVVATVSLLAVAGLLMRPGTRLTIVLLASFAALWFLACVYLFLHPGWVVPVLAPVVALLATGAAGFGLRRVLPPPPCAAEEE